MENLLLEVLNEAERADLESLSAVRRAHYRKGEYILHAEDTVREVGSVLSGSVILEYVDLWGNRSILGRAEAGQIFAETYALSRRPLMVDAVAAEDTEVLFLDISRVTDPAHSARAWYPKLLFRLLTLTADKNRVLSRRIFCTSAKTIRARLNTYFSLMAKETGSTTFCIPFDRRQMADYLNLDRSALSKELGKMRDEGLIEFYKNTFRLKRL